MEEKKDILKQIFPIFVLKPNISKGAETMKPLTIVAVCGFGVVGCVVLKKRLEDLLAERVRWRANVLAADLIHAVTLECDLIIAPDLFSAGLQTQVDVPVLGVANLLNPVEFLREGLPLLESLRRERYWENVRIGNTVN